MTIKKRAVFLDRDGVVNHIVDRGEQGVVIAGKRCRYTAPWRFEEFRLKDGVREAIEAMRAHGFFVCLATNQPDIAYGMMTEEDHERMMAATEALGFDDMFVCLHGREDGCACKKPKPGMFFDAVKKWDIDLSKSFMIGDSKNDVEAGRAAGSFTILIDAEYNRDVVADRRVKDLGEAVEMIEAVG